MQSKTLLNIKMVVKYLSFVFILKLKQNLTIKFWILFFNLSKIKNMRWHFGYTDYKYTVMKSSTSISKENKNNKKTLCVVTIAIICSNLASLWKFQSFRRPIYNLVEHLWWSFYCKNKALQYIHKKAPS